MVTAEVAVAIPVVLSVLTLGLGAVRLGIDEVRCVDAARLAARALARGDPAALADAYARRAAPAYAVVAISITAADVTVDVTATRELAGMRMLTLRGSATASMERA